MKIENIPIAIGIVGALLNGRAMLKDGREIDFDAFDNFGTPEFGVAAAILALVVGFSIKAIRRK